MRVKIFDLSWNVDLNRLENEINIFLAMLPGNAVKHVQSAASSTRTRDTDQMQTDYLVTVVRTEETRGQEISAAVKFKLGRLSRTETTSQFRSLN
jgi:hypothetical protein